MTIGHGSDGNESIATLSTQLCRVELDRSDKVTSVPLWGGRLICQQGIKLNVGSLRICYSDTAKVTHQRVRLSWANKLVPLPQTTLGKPVQDDSQDILRVIHKLDSTEITFRVWHRWKKSFEIIEMNILKLFKNGVNGCMLTWCLSPLGSLIVSQLYWLIWLYTLVTGTTSQVIGKSTY